MLKYGDRVKIIEGFYSGNFGKAVDCDKHEGFGFYRYKIRFMALDDYGNGEYKEIYFYKESLEKMKDKNDL